jgi:translocation and assembly module TamB
MLRRLAVVLASLILVVAVVLAATPWWLGFAIKHVGPSFGVTIGSYERLGYGRFRVREVEVVHAPVRVRVDVAEADTPVLWLWRKWTGTPGDVIAGRWSTEVSASKNHGSSGSGGWRNLQRLLVRISDHLGDWVPRAHIGPGFVTWPGSRLDFASAEWNRHTIATPSIRYRTLEGAVSATFSETERIDAEAVLSGETAKVAVKSNGPSLTATGTWLQQPVTIDAHFGDQGWPPQDAVAKATHWNLPGARLRVTEAYDAIVGDAEVSWKDGDLRAKADFTGRPKENSSVPPLSVKVAGQGTNDAFVAESLEISLPGVSAHLSAPVSIDVAGKLHSEPSDFSFSADLSRLPWIRAKGMVNGKGQIMRGADDHAQITFTAGGKEVSWEKMAFAELVADGEFVWPRLTIKEAKIKGELATDLTIAGGWDFPSKEIISATAKGRIARPLISHWLGEYPKFDVANIEVKASGPYKNVKYDGRAEVTGFIFKGLHPATARINWQGEGRRISELNAVATAGNAKLDLAGSAELPDATVTKLTFANGEVERWHLGRPVTLTLREEGKIEGFALEGSDAQIMANVSWGKSGAIDLRASHVDSEWLRPVVVLPSVRWRVDTLTTTGTWADGPAEFSINAGLSIDVAEKRTAQISADLKGSKDGLEISTLRVAEGGGVIVNGQAHLPLFVRPAGSPKWEVRDDAAFSLKAATSPNPEFWEKITELTGVEIVAPQVSLEFDGTLAKPRGEARVQAQRLAPREGRFKGVWPKIEGLNLRAVGDNSGLTIEQFSVSIEGQSVKVSGHLPDAAASWRELMAHPREVAQRGELHLEIPDAEIAAFVHYFPEYIAPKGRFDVDLTLHGEQAVDGFIRLRDATSKPLGPLGVLQEIAADIRFSKRTANFTAVTARMGGQLVTLQGTAELPPGKQPLLDLSLRGENLPFVRKAGLLVRGDLDLKLVSDATGASAIRGNVRMRDSLFLADVRSFLPSGARGVENRPPYFSVNTPPLNTWGLDVQVRGNRFMRLRTPVFNGSASSRFHLEGTLGEPRLSGEATIDEGTIRLPFANFSVQQGEVRISNGDADPQIFVTATTRRFGYDLRMEITGATSAPNLAFSSSPPLEAEQVLLMVMAGEAPRNEVSTTDRQRVARFGAFFGQSLLGSLGGDSGGPDRLTISSGSDISEQGRETYNIEYRLNDRWALTGEYDEFDDYYGGLKWRVYPKGGKRSDEKK